MASQERTAHLPTQVDARREERTSRPTDQLEHERCSAAPRTHPINTRNLHPCILIFFPFLIYFSFSPRRCLAAPSASVASFGAAKPGVHCAAAPELRSGTMRQWLVLVCHWQGNVIFGQVVPIVVDASPTRAADTSQRPRLSTCLCNWGHAQWSSWHILAHPHGPPSAQHTKLSRALRGAP